MYKIAELFSTATSFQDYMQQYNKRLSVILEMLDREAMAQVVEILAKIRQNSATLFIIGNGGSAAAAAHLVNDLVAGAFIEEKPGFRALSLSDNISTLTALANDCGYDRIFEQQLKVYMSPGDAVLAMSVSGNSPNILRALNYARSAGVTTIGFCGFDGGKMKDLCDIVVHVPTTPDEYGPVEDVFSILGHIVSGYLAMKEGKMLHH